jgi:RimJ/RimL family protein N-acetyltransferase
MNEQPTADVSVRDQVLATLRRLKDPGCGYTFSLAFLNNSRLAALEPVTWADADRPDAVALLARWREEAADAFPGRFPVTHAGTHLWLIQQVLRVSDRLLFWLKDSAGAPLGHLGLNRFHFEQRQAELDNVVRGVPDVQPGIMTAAVRTLLTWSFTTLQMDALALRVFADNERAVRLYERCGFSVAACAAMAPVEEGPVLRWVEAEGSRPAERHLVTMRLARKDWRKSFRLDRQAA